MKSLPFALADLEEAGVRTPGGATAGRAQSGLDRDSRLARPAERRVDDLERRANGNGQGRRGVRRSQARPPELRLATSDRRQRRFGLPPEATLGDERRFAVPQ